MAEITIYEHANFQGQSQTLTAGQYDFAQLLIGNDTLSSALVPDGMVLRLYEHAHYQGASIEYRQDTPYVGGEWNDRVSSIIVYAVSPPAAPPPPPAPPAPLSLESIYQPLNKFFIDNFAAADGAAVTFRFSHLSQAFVDSDFLDPLHPEWGPSPAIAREQFSTVVDGVPRLDVNGRTVWLNTSRLSERYNDEIVSPAIPFVPDSVTNDMEKQARIDAFNKAKADAIGLWEKIKALSLLEGVGVEFRPSTATPGKWWDKTDVDVWHPKSFEVKGAIALPGPVSPSDQLLRMKVSDAVLMPLLQSQVVALASPQPSPAVGPSKVMLSRSTLQMADPVFTAALANDTSRAQSIRVPPTTQMAKMSNRRMRVEEAPDTIEDRYRRPSTNIHNEVTSKIAAFPLKQRLELQEVLATNAPTQSVVTNDVTISFDYCLVTIRRPWLHEAAINNTSWYIPGQGKGQLSANDGHGIPVLPVGFVAVKSLSIHAPWTPQDITNLEQSVQFGPFNFDSKVVNGAITHEGIQIVGWLLQTMPDLPPNAAPGG